MLNWTSTLAAASRPVSTCDRVTADDFTSAPIQALWRGFTHPGINWSGTVQFDGSRFLTRLAASATSEFGPEPGGDSYALIGTDYLNLSAKFGYHFATLDTFCGDEPDHNYLSLQFSGGAGSLFGKTLRLQFLSKVLGELGCGVQIQGDLLEASLNRHRRVDMLVRLDQIGRLLASSRLLDMAIADQEDVDTLTSEFMAGNYDLLNRKDRIPLPGFYTHLGHWQHIEDQGAVCWLADGSRSLGTLSTGVSQLMTRAGPTRKCSTPSAPVLLPGHRRMGRWATLPFPSRSSRCRAASTGGDLIASCGAATTGVLRINALEDNAVLLPSSTTSRVEQARADVPLTRGSGTRWRSP